MPNKKKKRLSATVSETFYTTVKQIASKRFAHRYMSRFLIMGLKILVKLHQDQLLVQKINKYVNKNYNHPKYEDKLAQFVEDAIREYLENHSIFILFFFNKLIIIHLIYFILWIPIHIINPSTWTNHHYLIGIHPIPTFP